MRAPRIAAPPSLGHVKLARPWIGWDWLVAPSAVRRNPKPSDAQINSRRACDDIRRLECWNKPDVLLPLSLSLSFWGIGYVVNRGIV